MNNCVFYNDREVLFENDGLVAFFDDFNVGLIAD